MYFFYRSLGAKNLAKMAIKVECHNIVRDINKKLPVIGSFGYESDLNFLLCCTEKCSSTHEYSLEESNNRLSVFTDDPNRFSTNHKNEKHHDRDD